MRNPPGQEEHLSLSDLNCSELSVGQYREAHVSFPHIEQLLSLLQVEVLPLVRAAHKENLQLIIVHHLVADGWKEELLVLFDPFVGVIMNRL